MFAEEEIKKKEKVVKKITPQRLKNIALYYLKRFETTASSLRQVLVKRINEYAYYNPGYDKSEAMGWVENIISDFERYGYVNDGRFAELKCRDYIAAGKPRRYIENKLREKGVSAEIIGKCFEEQEYDPLETALLFARKKRIGPFRQDEEQRRDMKQKDMGTLVRAGFDYDIVITVLDYEAADE